MLDVEIPGETGAQLVEHACRLRAGPQDDVGRDDRESARDRPGMEIVDVGDALRADDVRADDLEPHPARRRLQQDVDRLAQEADRPRHDERGDDDRRDRVGVVPAGHREDDGRDDDRHGTEEVAEHFQVRAPDIERAGLGPPQERRRCPVRHQADDAEDEHESALDFRRILEAADRRDDDERRDADEQDGIRDRRQDLGPVVAEGAAVRRGPAGDPHGDQREADAGHIGQDMACVGEDGEAVRRDPADDLDDQERDRDGERDRQVTSIGRASVQMGHPGIGPPFRRFRRAACTVSRGAPRTPMVRPDRQAGSGAERSGRAASIATRMGQTRYDFVIVGGGSAGSALANRLSVDPATRVLVLEAGRSDWRIDPFIHMPAALTFPIGSRFYDWSVRVRARAVHARPADLPRARQGPRRLVEHQRPDLPAR